MIAAAQQPRARTPATSAGSVTSQAAQSANIDQCTNGPVAKGVITPEPCLIGTVQGGALSGSSFSNWVNGNSNSAKSHWREGEFIAYRVDLEGLASGAHTLVIQYDTVHGGKHAIDYLGSFDATETTALSSTTFHYNFNNPCVDILGATACPQSTPPTPVSTLPINSANLINCAGSAGGPITQIAGSFKMFAASGSVLNSMSYPAQNTVAGTGQCSTQVSIVFTVPSGVTSAVIAWGGHIASQADWGFGNSASAISGSPYHMALVSLDGASVGSQDRALATSAIFFTPTISTTIFNLATGLPVPGTPPTANAGVTVYDTSTFTGISPVAGGTVYYNFFTNIGCTLPYSTNESVSVSSGVAPNSPNHGPLAAGQYSFNAFYSGDPGNNVLPAKSTCEQLIIQSVTPTITTTVKDSSGNAVTGPVPLGTTVHDTATLSGGVSPITGTVTYSFFNNNGCTGTAVSMQTVTVGAGNSVPDSSAQTLGAGSYSYNAHYSGDTLNQPATSACEPFSVSKASPSLSTTIVPSGPYALGSIVHDTAAFSGLVSGFPATGMVTYTFFRGDCSGTVLWTQTVTIGAGSVIPASQNTAALATGSYAFQASWPGDSNYNSATSACEPFSVNKASSTLSTTIAPAGPYVLGAVVHDTSAFAGLTAGFDATGTVTYTFYNGDTCSGTVIFTDAVTIGAGSSIPNSQSTAPLAAGFYSFRASWPGDSNYNGATSACEPLTVGQFPPTSFTTTVFDAATSAAWSGTETTGASAYDTATLTGLVAGFTPTGTVTYTFFLNGDCSGTGVGQVVTLNGDGSIPNSATHGPLSAGSYSFQAAYSGDPNYIGATSACEPFTVNKGTSSTATVVFDAGTAAPWSNTETTGASAYDTASVTTSDGFVATGTVAYTFFTNDGCVGAGAAAGTVTLTGAGLVPNSNTEGPLQAGSYSFQAVYSGDSNYGGSTSPCEPFSVAKGTSNTATIVFDAGTAAPWTGTESTGASAYDTATVTTSNGFTATGTVTYTFFTSGDCSGTGVSQIVTLASDGSVPNSAVHGPLQAGAYSFQATYSGDSNYGGSTSSCEPFTVAKGTSNTATVVFDAATNKAWTGTETTGASAYDTATVTTSNGFTATGTITYTFFTTGDCSGAGLSQVVTLNPDGSVPNSAVHGPLQAGAYSFQATYSGDSNYGGSTSSCEPFSVGPGTSNTATVVFDAATNAPWSGSEQTGASAYDTATVTTSNGFVATGTVAYAFFQGGTCSGTAADAGTVTLTGAGLVPNSITEGPLTAGSYSFQATYSGDSNYGGSVSPCEPFSVAKAPSSTATVVIDASTGLPWSGFETTGASAYDTATVSGQQDSIVPTGTVTYFFFTVGDCSGTAASTQPVSLSGGVVPNSNPTGALTAGSYSFQAVYSGDSNYAGSTGSCEPFTVNQGTSSTATVVFDAGTAAPWSNTETTGASAYDTATVTTSDGFTATGTVTYSFFTNGGCAGGAAWTQPVSLNPDGSVPNSHATGPLTAGSYSFQAVYSGDGNYLGSTGPCEPFTVQPGSSNTATTVFDAATHAPWSGLETTGASAYDTASVTTSDGFVATGTVAYAFFHGGTCSGTAGDAGTVTLDALGNVPNSNTEGPLAAGSYSFQATYSGDSNYGGSSSPCEPFTVNIGSSNTATVVFDAATSLPWSGSEITGASAYDTATVTTSDGFTATGTVTYSFFTNDGCAEPAASTQLVSLAADGSVPNSNPTGPLTAGSYSFQAVYSGDSNYAGSTGACEPFSVAKAPSTTATEVFDAATKAPWSGTETTGASAYDTATVSGQQDGIVPSGTVAYAFFQGGTCSGTGLSAGTVTLTGAGLVPNSLTEGPLAAGMYSFQAMYSGDSNYVGSTSPCEPFTVNIGSSTTATVVFDASTNLPWSGTEQTGASAYDTASVTPSSAAFVATGTVTYTFFTTGDCSGTGVSQIVTLAADGSVPNSNPTGPLTAGSYSFQAMYSGDSNYAGSTGACEPFSVSKAPSSTATVVFDASTNLPWSGTEQTGASAYDTATVSGQKDGIVPTGTVTYFFFTVGDCSGTAASTQKVSLAADGSVPNSDPTGPLTAGSYGFVAVYSGDANYDGSSGACEPFSVAKAPSSTATIVFDASTNLPWSGSETTGAAAYDTATVSGQKDGIVPTGTVTYTFFQGDCAGTVVWTQVVHLDALGHVPNSNPTGPLTAGSYAFQAVYSGDANYDGSNGACEPFSVGIGSSNTVTTVFDALTQAPWSGTETTGASAYDTASVTTSDGFVATGTVSYAFFHGGTCSGTAANAGTVTLDALGNVPNSNTEGPLAAGSYSFQATYSGDSNYAGSTSPCEPFTVNIGSSTTATEVFDAATSAPWSGSETTGASAFDTASVTPSSADFVATGTVFYAFFQGGSCSGASAGAGTVNLDVLGLVPNSITEGPLAAGSYAFQATYSGDSNYAGSTSPCEPFTVNIGSSTTATVVFDATTNLPWSGTEQTGASAYDTASVTPSSGAFVATGTVTYFFFMSGTCVGTGASAGTVSLAADGTVPNSNTMGPLAAGSYAFQATYSGDSNYAGSTSPCEPFAVAKAPSTLSTTIEPPGPYFLGAVVHDTSSFGGIVPGFDATGTVTYTFFKTDCFGTVVWTQGVPIGAGSSIPNSHDTDPLAAGSYAFQASWPGDANYNGATSACEPMTVAKFPPSAVNTIVFDAATNAAWTGTETTGASAYDTATVTGISGFTPTGSVIYTFFMGDCTGTVVSTQTVTLSGGIVPNSNPTGPLAAGAYAFQAAYSGDSNYLSATSACEPFSVAKATPGIVTAVSPTPIAIGGSAHDTATLSGLVSPTGTGSVSFSVYSDAACTNLVFSSGATPASVTGNGNYVSGTFTPSAPGTYYFVASFSGDANNKAATTKCGDPGETLTVNPSFGELLDTNQCPFDVNGGVPGNQFLVNFQKSSTGTYKIASTNPGQFYYDAFFYGAPGSAATITITVPWPFVTQGAMPVHVYSAFSQASSGCVTPINDITGGFAMSGPGSSTGEPMVTLASYPAQADGSQVTFKVTGTVPSSGLVFVTVHLAWGLNGSTGWSIIGSCTGNPCIADAQKGSVSLPNNFGYTFGFTESHTLVSITNKAYNQNDFNK